MARPKLNIRLFSLLITRQHVNDDFYCRALEEGDLEVAAKQKDFLENKQREYRKQFNKKKENEWWTPKWFEPCKNPATNEDDWRFKGGFWDGDFSKSPEIF